MSNRFFKTPSCLKIRLNYRYFFRQIVDTNQYYSDEEILNNDKMYNVTANIEFWYLIPITLLQVFALYSLFAKVNIIPFCVIAVSLYAFGCLLRCFYTTPLLSNILMFFAMVYKMIWWLFYIAIIVLMLVLDCKYLIFPYIAVRCFCFLLNIFQSRIVKIVTKKKFGVALSDVEICAFVIFHLFSNSTERLSEYIEDYVEAMNEY